MKAVIMAGGQGLRLRPITDNIPKPLLPVDGIPAITRILKLLKHHKITEAAITSGYLSESIENALGAEAEGIKLTYFKENTPLGTAGGVAATKDFIGNEDFIVISGDAVCETDLSAAAMERKKKDATVLMVLTRVSDPGEYGVVLTNDDSEIIGFCEKPSVSSTYSDRINTGIYVMSPRIFEFIPEGKCDFSKDVFPKLLKNGEKMYGITDRNYWCDIGSFHSYRLANLYYSKGGSTVGKGCSLPSDGIVGSVLLDRVTVGRGTKIENSIICSDTVIGEKCIIGENSVIGAGSIIGDGSIISDGTVLQRSSNVPEGSMVRSGRAVSPAVLKDMLDGSGIKCAVGEMSPSFAIKLGYAVASACGFGRIGIMTDGSPDALRISSALLRGIGDSGAECMLLSEGFEAAASYAAVKMLLDISLFIRAENGECSVSFFDENGLYPKREFERALIEAISKDNEENSNRRKKLSSCSFIRDYYLPMITSNRCPLEGLKVTIKRQNPAASLLKEALSAIGGQICDDGIKLSVSDDGFSLSAEQGGFVCDDWHIKAILLRYLVREKPSLPISTPSALLDLCHKTPDLYTHCPTGDSEDDIRKNVSSIPELIHACAAATELVGLMSVSNKSLKELCKHIPDFAVSSCHFKTRDRRRFSILTSLGSPGGDGIVSEYERGSVRVIPGKDGYTLISEAASGEYAEELIAYSEREILNLLKKADNDNN